MRSRKTPRHKAVANVEIHDRPLGFRVWRMNTKQAEMIHAHSHPDIEVNFVTEGWVTYAFAGQVVTLKPGDLAVFWASIPHQAIDAGPYLSGVWLTFTLPMLLSWKLPAQMDKRLLTGTFPMTRLEGPAMAAEHRYLERWVDEVNEGDDDARKTVLLEVEARMRRFALETQPHGRRIAGPVPEPGIERALAFVHQQYRTEIRADDVADAAGWHPKYLMRVFKRTVNMSLGEYIARLRISHAQWLLISTNDDMLSIAEEAGFQSIAPFYQAFRKLSAGVTPLQFRKQATTTAAVH